MLNIKNGGLNNISVKNVDKIKLFGIVKIKSCFFVEIATKMYIKVEIEFHIRNSLYRHLIVIKNVQKLLINKIHLFIIVYYVNNQNAINALTTLYIRKLV